MALASGISPPHAKTPLTANICLPTIGAMNAKSPLILHLDIDAFFASVEQLRNPRLADRPVAVGSGVIASCSYEAREYGLEAGMPLAQAERLCPHLAVVEGHQVIYRCYTDRIFELLRSWAPQIETHLDEAFCDFRGTERLYPDLFRVGEELRGRIRSETGLKATVGIGRNRMFARIIGKRSKPDGLGYLSPQREEDLLLALPIRDLPGIGPKTHRVLEQLNIHTVAELRELPAAALTALFGLNGRAIYERSRGDDFRAVEERELPKTLSRETAFHEPTDRPAEIEGVLHYLIERGARSLRERDLEAGGIGVKLNYTDGRYAKRRERLDPPTQRDSILFQSAKSLWRALHERRVALYRIGIWFDRIRFRPHYQQPGLFDASFEAREENPPGTITSGQGPASTSLEADRETPLLRSIDEIRHRYGHSALVTGKSLHLLVSSDNSPGLRRDRNGFILRTPCLTK